MRLSQEAFAWFYTSALVCDLVEIVRLGNPEGSRGNVQMGDTVTTLPEKQGHQKIVGLCIQYLCIND